MAAQDLSTAEDIIAAAERRVGIEDGERDILLPNLRALVGALAADGLMTQAGRQDSLVLLLRRTCDRLEGLRWCRDYPEIADEVIDAPLFLTGLPRSGTTALQYLFDLDPRFRLIRSWEGQDPSPPPGADPASVAQRKADEELLRKSTVLPEGFEAIHLMDLDGPEECHMFLEQAYAAAGFHNFLDVPGYVDFLMRELDLEAAYRVHRRQLQLLQWRSLPRRWALKYPNHVLAMDAIMKVHPDARFVMTHRDPVQIVGSISRLTLSLRQLKAKEPLDAHRIGAQMFDFISRHIGRIMDFTDGPHAARIVHVSYDRLVAEPARAVQQIHAALGLDTPVPLLDKMTAWHRRNPRGARGANPYSLEAFGLDEQAVRDRFAAYIERFAIPRER